MEQDPLECARSQLSCAEFVESDEAGSIPTAELRLLMDAYSREQILRRILFLDIDGVLNKGSGPMLPRLVAGLSRVVEATGCELVISSDWRLFGPLETIGSSLREAGYTGPDPIGSTPDYGTTAAPRGLEIAAWLAQAERVGVWAIVDDRDDMAECSHRLVRTLRSIGLDSTAEYRLIDLLSETPR